MASKKVTEIRKLAKQVKANNKAFKRLTKAQKRAAIAKDVLQMLRKGKLKAKKGFYVCMGDPHRPK